MQTNDLIERFATDLRPMPVRAKFARLLAGLIGGGSIALAVLWMLLGPRADFLDAVRTTAFWSKWVYGLGVAAVGLGLCLRFARPERASGRLLLALAVPLLMLVSLALLELSAVPSDRRAGLWLGMSAGRCPWIIAGLALPVFAGVLWSFRRFAPTQPRLAGFSAGCLAGAVAVLVYAIHCNESASSFVATWYSAGMLLPGVLGFAIGPRILRW
jgi:hypothetical protein